MQLRKAQPGKTPLEFIHLQVSRTRYFHYLIILILGPDTFIQAFLEAAGVMTPAQNQPESMFNANPASTLLGNHPAMSNPAPEPETSADSVVYTGDTPQASTTPANADEEPKTLAARNVARLEYLRVEAKQLQA